MEDATEETKSPHINTNNNSKKTTKKESKNDSKNDGKVPEQEKPLTAEEYKLKGNDFFKNKDYGQSIEFYTLAISTEPDNSIYYGNRSAAYFMLKIYESALSDSLKAIELDQKYIKGYHRAFEIYLILGQIDECSDILMKFKAIDPKSKVYIEDDQKLSLHKSRLERVLKFKNSKSKKDSESACNILEALIEDSPKYQKYQLLLIDCQILSHNFDLAISHVSRLLRDDSYHQSELLSRRAYINYLQDNLPSAIKIYTQLLQNDPDNSEYAKICKKIKKLELLKQEGNRLFKDGDYDGAINKYNECLEVDPENYIYNAKLLCNRASAKMKKTSMDKYLESALGDYSKAIEYDSDYGKAFYRKAICLMKIGGAENIEEAMNCYDKASTLEPDLKDEINDQLHEAKKALKAAKRKDYYKILGVNRDVDETQLKKAYRKLALQWHPDRHSNEAPEEIKQAEIKFKDINEAYAVLSDADKRRRYDGGQDLESLDHDDPFSGMGGGGFNPMDIFSAFMGGGGGGASFSPHGFPGNVRFTTSTGGGGRHNPFGGFHNQGFQGFSM